ncbi:MAG TPA: uroporphyrinogen-III synthase [Lysobacter sp.]|jgi:uroporphyrinogen-III synthase|nr:uroporphyrinogen-III synthase [Lysobacter sp.]
MPTHAPTWYVISLRPRGEHDALRRAAARHGAGLIALSPWRLQQLDSKQVRADLRAALAASRVIFTSPAAVRAARALQGLKARRGQSWCAVGAGTAAALRRAGIAEVQAPARMDSEGLLALPALQQLDGQEVGLVTAPGGRNVTAPTLRARGARVLRAEVYAREAIELPPRSLEQVRRSAAPLLLALSSGEALQRVLAAVPADVAAILRRARVAAASERLAALARELGFADIVLAHGPRPGDLLAAACDKRATGRRASGSMKS